MTALPSAAEAQKLLPNDNTTALNLYDTVLLPAEKTVSEATDDRAAFRIVFARIARAVVQREIEACKDEHDINEALYALGEMYIKDFILPFYSLWQELTLQPTGVEPQDFYERMKERARQGQLGMPRDIDEAKNFAIARDDFRCMVSGVADYYSVGVGIIDSAKERERPRLPGRLWCMHADCCHIFPETLESQIREDIDYNPNIVTKHIHDELRGAKIHRLENIMMLATGIYSLLCQFDIWFEQDSEGDGEENCYRVGISLPTGMLYEHYDPPIPERVPFVAHVDNLPLPDPTYLHVHAACARVAHLSGAWRHLDPLYWEELRRIELENRALEDGDAIGPFLPDFP